MRRIICYLGGKTTKSATSGTGLIDHREIMVAARARAFVEALRVKMASKASQIGLVGTTLLAHYAFFSFEAYAHSQPGCR
ncbi:MAG: hypothetical protein J2P54_11620 [Bradyrhizobiaceae bacterium]|nr:hypothetical protein [Bradyrhizobiaceae bacterium]